MSEPLDESNEAVKDWLRIERAITEQVGSTMPLVRIPDWDPVDMATGLHWIRSMVLEGWYVDFLLDTNPSPSVLWLKLWEYGQPEPTWESVRR